MCREMQGTQDATNEAKTVVARYEVIVIVQCVQRC